MMMALAARYEVMTHATSSTLAESDPCMCGSATLVTLVSSTCITATTITEHVRSHFRAGERSLSPAASVDADALFGVSRIVEGRHGFAGTARAAGASGAMSGPPIKQSPPTISS